MSLTRRSFVKKSTYSAAAVTVLGTGVGLGDETTATKVVDHITEYSAVEIVLNVQNQAYSAQDKINLEIEPSTLAYTQWGNGGIPGTKPSWLPGSQTPDAGYPTQKTVDLWDYNYADAWSTDPSPLVVQYRAQKDSNGKPTGMYEAYIPEHKVIKEQMWGKTGEEP